MCPSLSQAHRYSSEYIKVPALWSFRTSKLFRTLNKHISQSISERRKK